MYDVTEIKETKKEIVCTLKQTDYAHYLYGNCVNAAYICRNCWAGALLETADEYYILGQTNDKTELPSELHLIGGCPDQTEVFSNRIDAFKTTKREVKEEIGIDIEDNTMVDDSFSDKYIISEGIRKSVGIVYKLKLKKTKKQVENDYHAFVQKLMQNQEEIEVSKLAFIKKEEKAIQEFLNENHNYIEYVPEMLKTDLKITK